MAGEDNKAVVALNNLVNGLQGRGRLRVWSLVVTVFGDAIVPRGGKAGLSVLQAIMERLGIENGALRTAMSRLAADGWVVRERSGRNSIYTLAASGRHAFDEATRRIYASGPPQWDGRWTVAVSPAGAANGQTGELLSACGFAGINGSTWLRPETLASPPLPHDIDGILVLTSKAAVTPSNPSSFFDLEATMANYQALIDRFSGLGTALNGGERLEPLDAISARTLLIHDWRRAVLHDPGLPAELLPHDWPGERCRQLVRRLYAHLAAPSESWITDSGLPPVSDIAGFSARFGIVERIEKQ